VTDVDQVIGDDAQADPALYAGQAFVATTVESVATLEETDAAFATGAAFLSVAEPAFLLEPLTLTLGEAIGDGHSLPFNFSCVRAMRFCPVEKSQPCTHDTYGKLRGVGIIFAHEIVRQSLRE